MEFTGFIFASDDPDSYLANMRLAQYGWKYHFMFTPEETKGGYIFLFYIFLGKLALLSKVPFIVMFHLARVVSGMVLLLSGWLFLKTLNLTDSERNWSFVVFSLGVQFPVFCHNYWGLMIYYPEVSQLANILLLPHIAFAQALFVLGLYFLQVWLASGKALYVVAGNLAVLGMALVYPYILLPFLLVSLFIAGFRKRGSSVIERLKPAAFLIAGSPYVFYLLFLITQPDFRQWQSQSATILSSPLEFVAFNSLVVFTGFFGLFLIFRREGLRSQLFWVYASPLLLMSLPLSFQERLLAGAGPGLSFAAGYTINSIGLRFGKRYMTYVLLALFVIPAAVPLLAPILNPPARSFMTSAEVSMYAWMETNLTGKDVVLADLPHSLRIPGRAGCRVWCGHHDQTFNVDEKHRQLKRFFTDDGFDRDRFLRENNIDYVLLGAEGPTILPVRSLAAVKRCGDLTLYKKEPAGG